MSGRFQDAIPGLFGAGKRLGPDAAELLDQVPDDDRRLFASIELAAALAGVPESPTRSRGDRLREKLGGGRKAAGNSLLRQRNLHPRPTGYPRCVQSSAELSMLRNREAGRYVKNLLPS